MEKKWIPYALHLITDADRHAVSKALSESTITRGKEVEAFEGEIAEYCGAQYGVAFNNGSSALAAAYHAADLGPYDHVITTPNSFIATLSPVIQAGATPVFIDIDRRTGNFDLEKVCENLEFETTRGKCFITPVHFGGVAVDLEAITKHLCMPETVIIEDAAHALGSLYPSGKRVGSCAYSDMTIFSFHPAKQITTGEGGMVTTNDSKLAERLRRFRNSGIDRSEDKPWYYEVQELSGNFHLTDFQAALGRSQLHRLDANSIKRRKMASYYRERLQDFPHLQLFTPENDDQTSFHLFVVQIDFQSLNKERNQVMQALIEKGIQTQLHYIPLYHHPAVKKVCGDLAAYFPEMEKYYAEALTLPLHLHLTPHDIDVITESLREVLI